MQEIWLLTMLKKKSKKPGFHVLNLLNFELKLKNITKSPTSSFQERRKKITTSPRNQH